jgi:hypothetical protein
MSVAMKLGRMLALRRRVVGVDEGPKCGIESGFVSAVADF